MFPHYDFWRRQWQPTPVLLPGKSHGWKSLVGCSPWGHEELDMTEWLHFHFSLSCIVEGNGNPLQCSCLENPGDGGAWWAAVYGVSQSRTWLKRLSNSSNITISAGNSTPNYIQEKWKHYVPTKTCTWMFISIIYNCPKMILTQMSINWWVDIQKMIHAHNTVLFSLKKRMEYWYMLQYGQSLKTSRKVKEASHKRRQNVQFHFCEMSRIGKSMQTAD